VELHGKDRSARAPPAMFRISFPMYIGISRTVCVMRREAWAYGLGSMVSFAGSVGESSPDKSVSSSSRLNSVMR